MLVEFSVANFCSFKDAQTLSMMLPQGMEPSESCFATGFEHIPYLLNLSALYGANGSGKTNLIKAMKFCKQFIMESAANKNKNDVIATEMFLFDSMTLSEPSEFYFSFLYNDYHFEYGLEVDNHIVHKEYLYATPKNGEQQIWFQRTLQDITIGDDVEGTIEQKNLWTVTTRDNALFLSTAVLLNSETLAVPYKWFKEYLRVAVGLENFYAMIPFTERSVKDDVVQKQRMLTLINNLGVNFTDFRTVELHDNKSDLVVSYDVHVVHNNNVDRKKYEISLTKESDGTKNIFALSRPILDFLDNGQIWVVDELHRSLHPNALEAIIKLFQNKDINTKNAQLIFSTHDTHPMKFLSRESVWLASKNSDNLQTELSSLSDFRGVPDNLPAHEIIDAYLEGTFGAVPHIGNMNNV